jgi:hypothetical protein
MEIVKMCQVPVAHAFNPNYSGGRYQDDCGSGGRYQDDCGSKPGRVNRS